MGQQCTKNFFFSCRFRRPFSDTNPVPTGSNPTQTRRSQPDPAVPPGHGRGLHFHPGLVLLRLRGRAHGAGQGQRGAARVSGEFPAAHAQGGGLRREQQRREPLDEETAGQAEPAHADEEQGEAGARRKLWTAV